MKKQVIVVSAVLIGLVVAVSSGCSRRPVAVDGLELEGGAVGALADLPAMQARAFGPAFDASPLGPEDLVEIRRTGDGAATGSIRITVPGMQDIAGGDDVVRVPASSLVVPGVSLTPGDLRLTADGPEPVAPTRASLGASMPADAGYRLLVIRGDATVPEAGDALSVRRLETGGGSNAGSDDLGGGGGGDSDGFGSGFDDGSGDLASLGAGGAAAAGSRTTVTTFRTRVGPDGRLRLAPLSAPAFIREGRPVALARADRSRMLAHVTGPGGPTLGQLADALSADADRPMALDTDPGMTTSTLLRSLGLDATDPRRPDSDAARDFRYDVAYAAPTWTLVWTDGRAVTLPLRLDVSLRDAVADAARARFGAPLTGRGAPSSTMWLTVMPTTLARRLGDGPTIEDDVERRRPFFGPVRADLERSAPFHEVSLQRGDVVHVSTGRPRATTTDDPANR